MHPFCTMMNKELSKYDINILGLEDKNHEYEFEGGNSFFQEFEQDIIHSGNFISKVLLEKNATFIRLNFDIVAKLQLECDRSLEVFEEEFKFTEKHIFKFGGSAEAMSDEIDIIPFGTHKINIAELLHDYILLQVPMKKLHPKFRGENSGDEEGLMVYTDPNFVEEKQDEIQDPRWAALINLKNKN